MEIHMTNYEMDRNLENLKAIARKKEMPGSLSYAIAKNIRKMQEELKEYLEVKYDLIQKYGELTDNKYQITDQDKIRDYAEEIQDIAQIEQTVDLIKISPKLFDRINITVEEIMALEFMIEDNVNE